MTGTMYQSYVKWPEGIAFDISACHAHTTGKKKSCLSNAYGASQHGTAVSKSHA